MGMSAIPKLSTEHPSLLPLVSLLSELSEDTKKHHFGTKLKSAFTYTMKRGPFDAMCACRGVVQAPMTLFLTSTSC